jgi:hypothetical protein
MYCRGVSAGCPQPPKQHHPHLLHGLGNTGERLEGLRLESGGLCDTLLLSVLFCGQQLVSSRLWDLPTPLNTPLDPSLPS